MKLHIVVCILTISTIYCKNIMLRITQELVQYAASSESAINFHQEGVGLTQCSMS